MNYQFRRADQLEVEQAAPRTTRRASSIARRIIDYIGTLANYYAAAAMYERLSRLSNAELQRRGLSRESLARDVLAAHDPAEHSNRERLRHD